MPSAFCAFSIYIGCSMIFSSDVLLSVIMFCIHTALFPFLIFAVLLWFWSICAPFSNGFRLFLFTTGIFNWIFSAVIEIVRLWYQPLLFDSARSPASSSCGLDSEEVRRAVCSSLCLRIWCFPGQCLVWRRVIILWVRAFGLYNVYCCSTPVCFDGGPYRIGNKVSCYYVM